MIKPYLRIAKNGVNSLLATLFFKSKIKVSESDKTSECIVFITETNMPRLERMITYLQPLRNENFILICNKQKFKQEFFSRVSNVSIYLIDDTWEIGKILNQLQHIKLIHALESRSIYPYFALKNKSPKTPFIFDFQDLYNNYTADKNLPVWLRENIYFENKCLNHSDGFISYSLELNPVRRNLHLKKKPSVYFPFYADDHAICAPNSKKLNESETHLVYAGGIAAVNQNISFNLTLTAQHIAKSNIYLHVYPSPNIDAEIIEEYDQYSKTNSNLIMHKSVDNKELSSALQQYDFALIPFFKTDSFQASNKYKYSTALKIWNFIEAGLPIIIMADVQYQAWLVKRLNSGMVLSESDLKFLPSILNATDIENFSIGIRNTQDNFKLSKNIYKINNLYNKLIGAQVYRSK